MNAHSQQPCQFLFLRKRRRMWSPLTRRLTLCTVLSFVRVTEELIHVFGYVGSKAHVPCPYDKGYESYEKYLCRNECGNNDVLITSNQANKTKYSIVRNSSTGVITVTISDLSSRDAGKYYCGVNKAMKDIYHEVKLHVEPDQCCEKVNQVQGQEESKMKITCPYEAKDETNLKYICMGELPSACWQKALVTSDQPRKGRFSLGHDAASRAFTVTIDGLARSDSGSYLCGVRRSTGLDVFSAVALAVKEWCCMNSGKLNGTAGSPVTLRCPYHARHGNHDMFLCKGEHRDSCVDMARTDERFTPRVDVASSLFSVTIQKLEAGDAGTYWCGAEPRWRTGNYTKIQLSVVPPPPTSTVTPITSQTTQAAEDSKGTSSSLVTVVTVIVTVVLLLVALCVWCKCCKAKGTKVVVGQNAKREEADDVESVADDYENQEVCSAVGTSKQLAVSKQVETWHRGDEGAGEDTDDSIYQNVTTENIYCNEFSATANKR